MKLITIDQVYRELGREIAFIKIDLVNVRLEPANTERDERLEKLERRLRLKLHLKLIIEDHLL
jgi:hypothetical protein